VTGGQGTLTGQVVVSAKGAGRWQAGHPWIYRTDVYDEPRDAPGIVAVTDRRGRHLGQALYSPQSEIRLRLLTRGREPIDAAWWSARISAALALIGFLTLYPPPSQSLSRRVGFGVLIAVLLVGLVELGRSFIPPAPLRLVSAEFGSGFQQESLQIEPAVTRLDPDASLRLYGLTAIRAPLGLKEKVQHRWYENGKLIFASPFYNMIGGREEGFRLWTAWTFDRIAPGTELRLDLETEGGQLIGRAGLKAGK